MTFRTSYTANNRVPAGPRPCTCTRAARPGLPISSLDVSCCSPVAVDASKRLPPNEHHDNKYHTSSRARCRQSLSLCCLLEFVSGLRTWSGFASASKHPTSAALERHLVLSIQPLRH